MKRDADSGPGKSPEVDDPPAPGWRTEGPWPTADGYRLSLLASIQTAEEVDLEDFFRKVYPEALPPSVDSTEDTERPSPGRETRQVDDG